VSVGLVGERRSESTTSQLVADLGLGHLRVRGPDSGTSHSFDVGSDLIDEIDPFGHRHGPPTLDEESEGRRVGIGGNRHLGHEIETTDDR
jgi:hypothetical protein